MVEFVIGRGMPFDVVTFFAYQGVLFFFFLLLFYLEFGGSYDWTGNQRVREHKSKSSDGVFLSFLVFINKRERDIRARARDA